MYGLQDIFNVTEEEWDMTYGLEIRNVDLCYTMCDVMTKKTKTRMENVMCSLHDTGI